MAVFDVRDAALGAVGDGEVGDTGGSRRSIDAAVKAGSGIVSVLTGTYRVTDSLVVSGHGVHMERHKTGGKSIVAQRSLQLRIVGVTIERTFEGLHLHNFNDAKVIRTRVAWPRGTFGCWPSGGGAADIDGRSGVIDVYDTVFGGDCCALPHDRHGLTVDGAGIGTGKIVANHATPYVAVTRTLGLGPSHRSSPRPVDRVRRGVVHCRAL